MTNSYRSEIQKLRIISLLMDTVSDSEQDKIPSRKDTPFVVVPFPVGVDDISVSNTGNRTTNFCVHYKNSQILLCLRGLGVLVWKRMNTARRALYHCIYIPHMNYPSSGQRFEIAPMFA